jgi:hypothetical protein
VNEIEAANSVTFERLNAQNQPVFDWEPSFAVVRSFRDQLVRAGNVVAKTEAFIDKFIDRAEAFLARNKLQPARAQPQALANSLHGAQFADLRQALRDLADSI